MSHRNEFGSAVFLKKFAVALVIAASAASLAWAGVTKSVTVLSGVAKVVNKHSHVDSMGREQPVSIQFTARPAHGTVRTQVSLGPLTLRNGTTRVVHRAEVIYQSRNGYVGQDTFTYRRVSSDPADDKNDEITVLVTVE